MCEICKNNESRTYTHARSAIHKRKLLKLMKKKKRASEKKYGMFIYEPSIFAGPKIGPVQEKKT